METSPSEDSTSPVEDVEKATDYDDLQESTTREDDDGTSTQHHNAPALTKTKSLENLVSLPREIAIVVIISLAQLTTQVGLTSVLSLIHVIGDHYHIRDPAVLSWLIAGYSLTVGSFILVSGRFGDVFGWKCMLVIGFTWFAIWTVILGLSWYSNDVLFIFARVLQGIGPSICLPNALALLGGLYGPGKRKNMAFAFFGGTAPVGGVLGFVLAGLFDLTWYPWLFWTLGILIGIIAAVAAVVIPDPQPRKVGIKGKSFIDVMWELDLLAAVVGITALVLFNVAWNQAPVAGWSEPYIIVTLILGVLLIPAFFYIELKLSPSPLLPFDVFTADNAFVLICLSSGWANFGIWIYYLTIILQTLRGISPLLLAAYYCPIAVSGMVAAITTGRLLGILRPAWVMLMALCFFVTGTSLVATLPPHQIYWAQIFVTAIVAPWGMDMSFLSATIIVSNSVKKEHQGVGASLVNTIVNYSISLGLGFAGTVQTYSVPVEHSMAQMLRGYRAALYMGIGLVSLGWVVAVIFVVRSYWSDQKKARRTADNEGKDGTEQNPQEEP